MKKLTESIDDVSKFESSIESIKDSLSTISDNWEVKFLPDNQLLRLYIAIIDKSKDGNFINASEFVSPNGGISIQDLEHSCLQMENTSNTIKLFIEAIQRSNIEYKSVFMSIGDKNCTYLGINFKY